MLIGDVPTAIASSCDTGCCGVSVFRIVDVVGLVLIVVRSVVTVVMVLWCVAAADVLWL